MNLKENIKRLRLENKVTQEQISKLTSISKGTIRAWEQGLIPNNFLQLEELIKVLNCTYDDLLK